MRLTFPTCAKLSIRLAVFLSALFLSGLLQGEQSSVQVMPLLKGYEWQFDADRFRALPPDSYRELLQIARNETLPRYMRERAMVALRIYPNDEVWTFFDDELSNAANSMRQRRAVVAMCQAFAIDRPQRVERAIIDMLGSEDPHLRVKVARCLKILNSESALQRFRSYRSKISEAWELQAVERPEYGSDLKN